MPKENAPELFGLFHYLHQLSCEAKRGMKASLKECPRCHFMMLEGVLANIEQHGKDGSIYVSDLAAAIRQPMPAVSRALRQLEQDGLIERIALREAIDELPEREKMTILLRFFKGLTQEQTARVLGVSQVQVSRLERRALQKLRMAMETEG